MSERVARGAEYLDETYPGWEGRIDLSTFDIQSPCQCVLGQVVPPELYERKRFVEDGYTYEGRRHGRWWTDAHGFCRQEDQDAWVALVKERFDTGQLSG